MSEHERLNNMSLEELREFVRFAYTAYPTLLETHEIRQAFFRQYPEKNPNHDSQAPSQGELDLQSRSNDGENLQTALENRGIRARDLEV